jgi:hypothetical protein
MSEQEDYKGRVRATAKGFYGHVRKKGEEFDYEGPLASWMEPLEKAKPARKAQGQKEPPTDDKKGDEASDGNGA